VRLGVGGGVEIDQGDLEWQVAAAVLVRAKISSLRKLRPGWPRHFELMLAEAERILNGDGIAPRETPRAPRAGSILVPRIAVP